MFNFLSKIFGKNNYLDFSVLNSDMHAHLIPGIDDGSVDIEETLKMIEGLKTLGFKNFITTPHMMPDVFKNTNASISEAGIKLNIELESQIGKQIHTAAEYYVDENFPERVRNNESFLTFGNNYILIEVSMNAKEKSLKETLFELKVKGYYPVLAHVERFPYMFTDDLNYYSDLKDADVLFQVNLRSFIGQYGETQRKIARALADNNMIDFLGTDLHRQNQLPFLEMAMKDSYVQKLLKQNKLLNKQL